ncbi:nacht and tpr domain containing [Fusarium albosuccineum]|uniref:Nacht and tpr domain containing n=1 Tax=Fusarium albosuccineum TaxID=1237068 RepID=A0A8H4KZT4_9HYPO|nr:nacht and tpr domain containing [Fusarium albosuccineum]
MARATSTASMEDMWRDAAARFKERTGKDVNFRPPRTMDDCIREMERNQALAEANEQTNTEKGIQYGIAILKCVKLLGGVAAVGAEMVFGSPASLCYNALSILLDIPEKLQNFREQLNELFGVLEPILSVFKIYDKMDQFNDVEPELKEAIHKVMISVVDICALTIELRSSGKWHNFKSKFKLVILDEDSVKEEIKNLRELTEGHYSVQATQTLKVVLDTKKDLANYLTSESERSQLISANVASLVASDDKRNVEDATRKHIDNIKRKLGIADSYHALKEMCDLPRKDCMPNTASWFMDLPEFMTWANKDDGDVNPLLIMYGAPNTGKSVILSAMVHHLRSTYEAPSRQSPRALIATYAFPLISGKDSEDIRPIATALKCLACQLAEQDAAYAKTLSQACDGKSDKSNFFNDAGSQELWDFLRIDAPKGQNLHYLVIDGLANLPEDSSHKSAQKREFLLLLRDALGPQVRIIVTARPDTFGGAKLIEHGKITVEEHTASDIQTYIQHDLASKDLFQDPDDEPLRTHVLLTLVKQVRGNFNKVRAALDNIRDAVAADAPETEIDRILEAASMNERQIFLTMVSQLEDKLTKDEIEELNELLVWVICGKIWFTIEKLNALLILRFQRKGTLRLKKKLLGKYSGIFGIRTEGGGVCIVDGMEELLTTKRTKPREVDETPTFSATITIARGDVRSVQSFLWSLSQKVDSVSRDIYGFEQVADQSGVKGKIQVNEVDGYLNILRRTFSILSTEPNDESRILGPDLIGYLPQHLDELSAKATDYDELTQDQKQDIGEGLFNLFSSGEAIERHWNSCDGIIWYKDADEVSSFRKWLDDPSVTRHLGRLDLEWLKEVRSAPNPNQALLAKIMKTVARRWLFDREWSAVKCYNWLKGYIEMPPPNSKDNDAVPSDGGQDAGQVKKTHTNVFNDVIAWCKQVLGSTTVDGAVIWYERVGETCVGLGNDYLSSAISAYRSAIDMKQPSIWTTHQGLAKALAENKQYEEACQEMDKALELLEKQEHPNKNTLLSAGCLFHAVCYLELKQPQRGIEYAKRALELTPEDHKAHFKLLYVYLMSGQTEDAVKTLKDLIQLGKDNKNADLFQQVLDDMEADDNSASIFGACLKALLGDTENLHSVMEEMRRASDRARKEDRRNSLIFFGLYEGIFHYRKGGENEEVHIRSAINCWDECMGVNVSSWGWHQRRMLAYGWACGHHFDQALAPRASNNEEAGLHVQKMHRLVENEASFRITRTNAYLGSFYANVTKDKAKSRTVLKTSFESAMQLLSDDDDDNDWEGYYHMAFVLTHSGDMLNALSAFSLLFPKPASTEALAWILDFEESPVRDLSAKVVEIVSKGWPTVYLQDQINLAYKHIKEVLPEQPDSGTNANANATASQSNEASTDGTKTPDQKGQEGADQLAENASKGAQESTTEPPLDQETRDAYAQIKSRLDEWLPRSQNETFWYKCSGPCGKMWGFDEAIHVCKHCFDTGFCDDCLTKLKLGDSMLPALEMRCNKDHEWLYVPKWDRELYLNSLKKRVRVGGEIDAEGNRVGGEMVSAEEWLSRLKKDWETSS